MPQSLPADLNKFSGVHLTSNAVTRGCRLVLRYNIEHTLPGPVYCFPTSAQAENNFKNLLKLWSNRQNESSCKVMGYVFNKTFSNEEFRDGLQMEEPDIEAFNQLRTSCEASDIYTCFATMTVQRTTRQPSTLR